MYKPRGSQKQIDNPNYTFTLLGPTMCCPGRPKGHNVQHFWGPQYYMESLVWYGWIVGYLGKDHIQFLCLGLNPKLGFIVRC